MNKYSGSSGIGIHPSRAELFSVSISHPLLIFPCIFSGWSVTVTHASAYSHQTAGSSQGHPNAPKILDPSFGAIAGSSNGEQGSVGDPLSVILFVSLMVIDFVSC